MSVENYSDSSTDSTIKELKRVFFTRLAFGLYKIQSEIKTKCMEIQERKFSFE